MIITKSEIRACRIEWSSKPPWLSRVPWQRQPKFGGLGLVICRTSASSPFQPRRSESISTCSLKPEDVNISTAQLFFSNKQEALSPSTDLLSALFTRDGLQDQPILVVDATEPRAVHPVGIDFCALRNWRCQIDDGRGCAGDTRDDFSPLLLRTMPHIHIIRWISQTSDKFDQLSSSFALHVTNWFDN